MLSALGWFDDHAPDPPSSPVAPGLDLASWYGRVPGTALRFEPRLLQPAVPFTGDRSRPYGGALSVQIGFLKARLIGSFPSLHRKPLCRAGSGQQGARWRRSCERTRQILLGSHFALFTWPILDLIRRYPLVVHFHDPWSSETAAEGAGEIKRRAGHVIERAVYRRAARLITLSRACAEVLCRSYGTPEERVRIIPGGVDAQRFAVSHSPQRARAEFAPPNDRPVIGTVRRLARRMGLADLLAAIALIKAARSRGAAGDCRKRSARRLSANAGV